MSNDKYNREIIGNDGGSESVDFVRVVAHSFNNILGVVLGNSELIGMDQDAPERVRERASNISNAANLGHELTQRLMAIGGGPANPISVTLEEALTPSLEKFRDGLRDNVKFVESFCTNSQVLVDPEQLRQAVGEILANGRDFAGDGVLLLTVSEEQLPESILIPPSVSAVRWVRIRVEDSGVGFGGHSPAILFEDRFSTRAKGLGIGLTGVARIVRANGLGLDASGQYGGVFDLFLPIVSETSRQPEVPRHSEPSEVWIVEDEEALLEFMTESLEMEGYVVRAFSTPTELLEVLQPAARKEPDLLVLDVALPEMSGPELLEEIHQRGWTPKVLWSSGYRSNAHLSELSGSSLFLQKPYTPGDLVDAVRKAI